MLFYHFFGSSKKSDDAHLDKKKEILELIGVWLM